MKKIIAGVSTIALAAALLSSAMPAFGAREFGMLYFDDTMVRTHGVPARLPHGGNDPLYVVMGGVPGQLAITPVAPGSGDYHGGAWAFYGVTWNVAPYLLTSYSAVMAAAAAGDVTITRDASRDFRCPIHP